MSYILDALRRADSERERGAVPGIHAQPVPPHWRDASHVRRMRPWVGAVIGLSVVVLGAFAWHLAGREPAPDVASMAAPASPLPVTAAPATPPPAPPVQQPAPPPQTVAVAPDAARKQPERSATATLPPRVEQQAERPSASPRAERKTERPPTTSALADTARRKAPAGTAPAAASDPAAARAAMPAPPVSPAANADARVYGQSELPQDIRRQLPTLSIGGSMYSDHPSSRMLIVNGQLVHEGDTLAPGLSLEQIKLKSAILRFKGYRYEITY